MSSSVHWPQLIAGWSLPALVHPWVLRSLPRLGLMALLSVLAIGVSDRGVAAQPQASAVQPPVAEANEAEAPASSPTGGLITIESDTQSADNLTGVVTAAGNVRIVYPSRGMVATARQAQYFSREGRLVLSGDVDVTQKGGNALRAERVIYLLDQERAEADPTPGQQVFSQMVIGPDRKAPTPLAP